MKIMHRNIYLIAILLGVVGLSACSQDDTLTPDGGTDNGNAIRFTTAIADFTGDTDSGTRATIDETDGIGHFDSGDQIGIYAYTDNSLQVNNIFRTATLNGTAWEYNTPLRWSDVPGNSNQCRIIGHYPLQTAQPDEEGKSIFTVQSDQSTIEAYRASDLLVSGTILNEHGLFLPVETNRGEPVTLNFVHVMSRIKVTLTAGDNVSQEVVNSATVKIKNAQVNYMISFILGNNGAPGSPSYADITPLKSATAPGTFYALVPRQFLTAGDDWIEVTAGGKTVNYAVPANILLKCGTQQVVNLTLTSSGGSGDENGDNFNPGGGWGN